MILLNIIYLNSILIEYVMLCLYLICEIKKNNITFIDNFSIFKIKFKLHFNILYLK